MSAQVLLFVTCITACSLSFRYLGGRGCKAIVKFSIRNLEKAMLRKLAQGHTLPQVARSFGLSMEEAKSCHDRICGKLGLHRPVIREDGQAVGLASPRTKLR